MLAFLSIKTRVRTECSGSFCVCSLYLVAAADGCGRLFGGRRPLEGGAVDRTCARWTGRGFRTGKSRTLFSLCTTSSRCGFHSGPRFSDVLLVPTPPTQSATANRTRPVYSSSSAGFHSDSNGLPEKNNNKNFTITTTTTRKKS